MTWTATINSTRKNELGDVEVSMTYENGVDSPVNEVIKTSTPAIISQMIKNRVAQLQIIDDYIVAAPIGTVDITPKEEVPPAPPSQEDLDKQAYQEKRYELISLKQDFDFGIISQEDLDSAILEVKELREKL